jgi:glyoxylase-like metal-dependent hydrolase (beta-lactamase superfamily II)
MMSCGYIRGRKNIYVPEVDRDVIKDTPMPVCLVTHPKGNVLFDTGPNPKVFEDAAAVWGGLAKAFEPIGDENSGVVGQLKKIGFKPDDVRYVVISHLHFDHAGGNGFFPGATFLVGEKEFECARRPELEGKGYFRAEWDLPLDYKSVPGEYDIFGDGKILLYPMPGHTEGHQVMLVRLEKQGPILLSGDSVPCRENFEKRIIPRNHLDSREASRSVEKLHELVEKENAMITYGHDADFWESLKKAPEYYE